MPVSDPSVSLLLGFKVQHALMWLCLNCQFQHSLIMLKMAT